MAAEIAISVVLLLREGVGAGGVGRGGELCSMLQKSSSTNTRGGGGGGEERTNDNG